MRILIVEDDREAANYIRKGLRESGHVADHAPDGEEGLEMARAAGAGWAVGVLTGNGGREHLEPYADVILEGVADVTSWLDAVRA